MVFEVLGKPQGKARPRFTKSGHTYTPKETAEYEKLVKKSYQMRYGTDKLVGEIEATIIAVYPIPKSASKKKRADMEDNVIKPTVKPDCDNIAKAVLDALNKVAYDDDSQIVSLTVKKVYGDTPRVIVQLDEIAPPMFCNLP